MRRNFVPPELLSKSARVSIGEILTRTVMDWFPNALVQDHEYIDPVEQIMAEHGIEGMAGKKGKHIQTYDCVARVEEGKDNFYDVFLQKFVHKAYKKMRMSYPNIQYREDGSAFMDGLRKIPSGGEYIRVLVPYDSNYAGGVNDYLHSKGATQDKYMYVDIPFTSNVELKKVLSRDFLTRVRTDIRPDESVLTPYREMKTWYEFETSGKHPPSIVVRGESGIGADKILEDPRIGMSITMSYRDNPSQNLAGMQMELKMGHTTWDGAPVIEIVEELAKDKNLGLTLDSKSHSQAILLQDKWFGDRKEKLVVDKYDSDTIRLTNAETWVEQAEARDAANAGAVLTNQGARAIAELSNMFEVRARIESDPYFLRWIKELHNSLRDKPDNIWGVNFDKINLSTYQLMAMQIIQGGGIVVPVNPVREKEKGRMELSAFPANAADLLTDLYIHIDKRIELMSGMYSQTMEPKDIARFRNKYDETMLAVKRVIKAYTQETDRASSGSGTVTAAKMATGVATSLVEEMAVHLAPMTLETVSGSNNFSGVGLLNVPGTTTVRGKFTTAGDKDVDYAVASMNNSLESRTFMNDSLGLFWITALMLGKSGADGFVSYLKTRPNARRTLDFFEEYMEALHDSEGGMHDGMIVPKRMLELHGNIVNNKRQRRKYTKIADDFLLAFAEWTNQNTNTGGEIQDYTAEKLGDNYGKILAASAMWRIKSQNYMAGCMVLAMQMGLRSDGFEKWEDNLKNEIDKIQGAQIGLRGGYNILLKMREEMIEAQNRMNNLIVGRPGNN